MILYQIYFFVLILPPHQLVLILSRMGNKNVIKMLTKRYTKRICFSVSLSFILL